MKKKADLFLPFEDLERLIRRRNRVEPSLLFDFEEIDMNNNNQNQGPPPVGPILGPDLQTMEELLQAPTEGVGDAIVVPPVLANQFELKIRLLNLLTAISFHGFENDDPKSHIKRFLTMIRDMRYVCEIDEIDNFSSAVKFLL
ncbi:hypothetical protein Tco_1086340 [Tanacetum coccineum]